MDNFHLLSQAFIYLLAAVVAVPLAKKLGLGSVLGYLIAGIIIGPFSLNIVGNNTEDIMRLAEFGIVMMLFLVGLEMRPSMLWEMRKSLLLNGGLQVIVTAIVIAFIAHSYGQALNISITLGMIFALSSTAIVLQILHEKGWIKLEAGNTIFSILLFQDIAVIPMIAVFPLLGTRAISQLHSPLHRWQQALLTITAILIVIASSKYLLRPVFYFIAKSKLNEAFTALALLLIIGITLTMHYVGLSPALGAFLAGVVLAESEYRHELEADIEPFKGLMLGLFFISVGTNIDFNVISNNMLLIITLVMALILIKFSVLLALGRIGKIKPGENWLIALMLAQGGEFCFVLISYATQTSIFPEQLADKLIAVVTLSMLLTPIIMMIYDKITTRLLSNQTTLEYDITNQDNPVIIAGLGRVGQIVSRYLMYNGIKSTILDSDPNQIETTRKFGQKAFFGDASRLDLLEIAGLANAKLLVFAIDDSNKAIDTAVQVRINYPKLKILIRVRNRSGLYEATNRGFSHEEVYRETFDSAIRMAEDSFQILGGSHEQTASTTINFKHRDKEQLEKLRPFYRGKINDEYINQARINSEQLEKILKEDQKSTAENITANDASIRKDGG